MFLLEKEEWEKRMVPVEIPEKFLLCYSLAEDAALDRRAEEIAKEKGLKILVIHSSCEKKMHVEHALYRWDIGPGEFLFLIKNAAYILTNSFHATAFSVIFGKEVENIASKERIIRAENLLRQLGKEMHGDIGKLHIKPGEIRPEQIEQLKNNAKAYLKKNGIYKG